MQPDSDKSEWKQPTEQPSQSPYTVPSDQKPDAPAPVVSMASDESPAEAGWTTQIDDEVTPTAQSSDEDNSEPVASSEDEKTSSGPEIQPVHWQAHEYIHREKNVGWFIAFTIVVIALMLMAIFLIQSITFAVLVPVMAVALLVYSHRPPRVLNYTLSHQGLHVNDHLYPFVQFKGFGVIHDGEEYSVMLIPNKRFQPGVSVYFPEEAGEAIVDMLGSRLPMQELHLDAVDRLVRKLRI
jgi:hypothetical protein